MKFTPKQQDRFWRHVNKIDGGCWLWTGCVRRGYPVVIIGQKEYYPRRVAWLLTRHRQPGHLHTNGCSNRRCCNPDHMSERKGYIKLRPRKPRNAMAQLLSILRWHRCQYL